MGGRIIVSTAIDPPNTHIVGLTDNLLEQFNTVRNCTESLAEVLSAEDQLLQSMPDASPTKWHLAHTTWFFETFILNEFLPHYEWFCKDYCHLFNSYYNSIGAQFTRSERGLISRPGLEQVLEYRHYVTEQITKLMSACSAHHMQQLSQLVELGCHHEQQHQELILTDIKHALSINPTYPVYQPVVNMQCKTPIKALDFVAIPGDLVTIGAEDNHFCYDNELPQHKVFVDHFKLANRLVNNAEYLEFIESGAYQNPLIWLSDAWAWLQQNNITQPIYWHKKAGEWWQFTLHGLQALNMTEPVVHLSYYEAEAYASWSGKRLVSEFEWELAAKTHRVTGNLLASHRADSCLDSIDDLNNDAPVTQMFGDAWEWTRSAYTPYPGYRPAAGAIGEYNGKFMSGQMVLKGGSSYTPQNHIRASYRNFFPPNARWQRTGIRLAE